MELELTGQEKVCSRPWGAYQVLDKGPGFQVKRLEIFSGQCLSLQKHFKRSEHWTVVKGQPTVTLGHQVQELQVNDSIYIPAQMIHRLANKTAESVIVIEVQTGSYFGEDDIFRLEDVYGRVE